MYKHNDDCIAKAFDDERLFVLMARDPAAPGAILQWVMNSLNTQPAEKLKEALDCALEMRDTCDTFRKLEYDAAFQAGRKMGREEMSSSPGNSDGTGRIRPEPSSMPPEDTSKSLKWWREQLAKAETDEARKGCQWQIDRALERIERAKHAQDAKAYLEHGLSERKVENFTPGVYMTADYIQGIGAFANWLSATRTKAIDVASRGEQGFIKLAEEFVNSIPAKHG